MSLNFSFECLEAKATTTTTTTNTTTKSSRSPQTPPFDSVHEHQDKYITGSICLIRLTNFVTYNKVEFRPGPNLNMVIGWAWSENWCTKLLKLHTATPSSNARPNGTGKSTIVCAIALGLGGKPEILGRAKELKEFVKKNQDQATIEIELKTDDGSILIERSFKHNSNNSSWKVDGRVVTEKGVREVIRDLNIQVDNLCQFLPQDRVSEFAQMSSEKLLLETERAAGDPSLLKNHNELVDRGKRLKEMEQQAALEEQVARLHEKEKHLHEAKLLEMAIPLAAYDKIKIEFQAVRDKKEEIEQMKRDCEAKVMPVSVLVQKLKAAVNKAKDDGKEAQKIYDQEGVRKMARIAAAIEKNENEEKSHSREVKQAKKAVADIEARVNQARLKKEETAREVERIRADLERNGLWSDDGNVKDASKSPEVLAINAQITETTNEGIELVRSLEDLSRKKTPFFDEIKSTESTMSRVQSQLRQLSTVAGQKLDKLRSLHAHAHQGVQFLRGQHNLQFQKPVFEPICLGINPVNPEVAKAIETFIGYTKLTSFVTQTQSDYQLLRNHFYDKMKLRVNVVCVENVQESFRSKISPEEISRLGFDGVLIDFVTGDPVLMSALIQYTPLDETPICLTDSPNFNFQRVDSSRIKNYVVGKTSYSIKSAYGSISSKSETMKEAQILNMTVDTQQQAELNRRMHELHGVKSDALAKVASIEAEEADMRARYDEKRKQRTDLLNKRKELLNRRAAYDKKSAELEVVSEKWRSAQEEVAGAKERLADVTSRRHKYVFDRAKLNIDFANQQIRACEMFDQVVMTNLNRIQLDAEHKDAENIENTAKEHHTEINRAFDTVKAKYEKLRADARLAMQSAKDAVPNDTSEEDRKEVIRMKESMSLADLEVALAQAQARAELLGHTDNSILNQYEQRKKEIENKTERHEEKRVKIDEDKSAIQRLKSEWEPELQKLIDRISGDFRKALQAKDEDFEKWKIEIYVKFRDNEKLQILNKHRQSGGERSVTTITYLMALQRLSVAPFRVVDEINQGMDPRNERAVHTQMVHVACQPKSSQYFLITPKLLPDLEYHEKMKVLTIFNGDHQPERFDIEGFLEKKKKQRVL
ncbi:P-loop containing nucleoside triphosphate hydrolase protein [Rhizoclosmatium globosum]|uniref:Structural maintenance of chromosomes protein 5 n=1 Tax=Rhizoclosmatium globosum TaxID=329046 RepID=A0A1Y2CI12_9FUNG|nr:P-loop containing nucleoside triphosphate hydrolase protein [Rhizoclosmatium globosum]|eukprot:ORY46464.1 P-loop containing nucleoside triphosphate hydrolase protein [Rhizoclosmatium globosum]